MFLPQKHFVCFVKVMEKTLFFLAKVSCDKSEKTIFMNSCPIIYDHYS